MTPDERAELLDLLVLLRDYPTPGTAPPGARRFHEWVDRFLEAMERRLGEHGLDALADRWPEGLWRDLITESQSVLREHPGRMARRIARVLVAAADPYDVPPRPHPHAPAYPRLRYRRGTRCARPGCRAPAIESQMSVDGPVIPSDYCRTHSILPTAVPGPAVPFPPPPPALGTKPPVLPPRPKRRIFLEPESKKRTPAP